MPCPREQREALEKVIVGPHGVPSAQSRGRQTPEDPCPMRTCFQRDIDRITHSKAFRRLKHKTQVFLRPEGDHYRTRLTHTLEVSRLARTISRALMLNEDLTEAIALGHDLGHTPFGHAGERALAAIYEGTGFRHYEQSLRVVDRLERDGRGLNLCAETRIGILNHTNGLPRDTLEADVVRLSDRVAYVNHDLDDAVRGGIVLPEDVPEIVRRRIGERNSVRINSILQDVIEHSQNGQLAMSPEMEAAFQTFHTFMFQAVYHNPVAKAEEQKVEGILRAIWNHYVHHIGELPELFRRVAETDGPERAVCDYISGMTDGYAMEVYDKLFIPASWSIK